jgi:hypothetical protein
MTIHCMLEIRLMHMCDYVIVANNVFHFLLRFQRHQLSSLCATPSGTITITTQSGVEYSVNGTAYQSNSFAGLLRGYTLYVRNLLTQVCDHIGIY